MLRRRHNGNGTAARIPTQPPHPPYPPYLSVHNTRTVCTACIQGYAVLPSWLSFIRSNHTLYQKIQFSVPSTQLCTDVILQVLRHDMLMFVEVMHPPSHHRIRESLAQKPNPPDTYIETLGQIETMLPKI